MYGTYAYIDPSNHPNVGIYTSPMERLGMRDLVRSYVNLAVSARFRWKSYKLHVSKIQRPCHIVVT